MLAGRRLHRARAPGRGLVALEVDRERIEGAPLALGPDHRAVVRAVGLGEAALPRDRAAVGDRFLLGRDRAEERLGDFDRHGSRLAGAGS